MQSTIFVSATIFFVDVFFHGFFNVFVAVVAAMSPGDAERWLLHMSQFDELGEPVGDVYGEVGVRWALENQLPLRGTP